MWKLAIAAAIAGPGLGLFAAAAAELAPIRDGCVTLQAEAAALGAGKVPPNCTVSPWTGRLRCHTVRVRRTVIV